MEVVEIIVTVISSIIIGGILTLKFHYNSLYADTVSKSRMGWIDGFREEFSIIIAALTTDFRDIEKADAVDYIFQGNKTRAKLLTRLNQDIYRSGNEYNKVLADILVSLDFNQCYDFSNETIMCLMRIARKILEPEWQKVKREAKGKGS